jgi:hypothetical protein
MKGEPGGVKVGEQGGCEFHLVCEYVLVVAFLR